MKFTEDKLSQKVPTQLSFHDDVESCPSCMEILDGKRDDCQACGIVIAQFKRVSLEKRLKTTVAGLYHLSSFDCEALEAAWKKTEAVYHDTEIHHQFIHMCYRFKSLPYAAKMYAERLKANPQDDIAEVMKRRVLLLAHESLPGYETKSVPPTQVTASLMRLFNAILICGMIGGVLLLFMSALTDSKLYFFGLGLFIALSSLMSLLFMKRQLQY